MLIDIKESNDRGKSLTEQLKGKQVEKIYFDESYDNNTIIIYFTDDTVLNIDSYDVFKEIFIEKE